jgi:hypothetical protein
MEYTVDLPVIARKGQSPTNPVSPDDNYNGLCEKYAEEQVYGKSGLYPSAADAWNNYVKNGQAYQGTAGIQPGSLVYLSPDSSNSGYGHVGVADGKGNFTSATYNGIKTENIDDWSASTGQKVLGWVAPQKQASSGIIPL